MSDDSSSLNDPEDNSYKSYYKKNVNNTSGAVGKETDCPCYDQDYRDDVK